MKTLSFEEAERLDELDTKKVFPVDFKKLLPLLGLRTIDPPFWYDRYKKESYLRIVDEKKWLLAKIKYGI
jgi:hypothetical protein